MKMAPKVQDGAKKVLSESVVKKHHTLGLGVHRGFAGREASVVVAPRSESTVALLLSLASWESHDQARHSPCNRGSWVCLSPTSSRIRICTDLLSALPTWGSFSSVRITRGRVYRARAVTWVVQLGRSLCGDRSHCALPSFLYISLCPKRCSFHGRLRHASALRNPERN